MSSKDYNNLKVDEKKMKRMISNRESARRSRMKKEQHMKDLNDQIFYFTRKRDELLVKIEGTEKANAAMEMENMVLRSKKQELEKRLEYANYVCGWYEGHGSRSSLLTHCLLCHHLLDLPSFDSCYCFFSIVGFNFFNDDIVCQNVDRVGGMC
uniref:Putative basic-leucine zipper domain-containing protein n=1 Tax=Helianthus annuus TaxID=4232 RepID=A0A251VSB7_HELAN